MHVQILEQNVVDALKSNQYYQDASLHLLDVKVTITGKVILLVSVEKSSNTFLLVVPLDIVDQRVQPSPNFKTLRCPAQEHGSTATLELFSNDSFALILGLKTLYICALAQDNDYQDTLEFGSGFSKFETDSHSILPLYGADGCMLISVQYGLLLFKLNTSMIVHEAYFFYGYFLQKVIST